jgi:hypothetical protein
MPSLLAALALGAAVVPRIVPMPRRAAAVHLERWRRAVDDPAERQRLRLSRAMLLGGSRGGDAVAVVHGSRATALALLEAETRRREGGVRVWLLHADDAVSGTLLLRELVREVPGHVRLAADVADRWRVALAYLRESGDEEDDDGSRSK